MLKTYTDSVIDYKTKRVFWLDVARTIAITMVVLNHATEHIYKLNINFFEHLSFSSKIFAHMAFTTGRLGVPIFLFLTGYLLLGKYYSERDCQLFWKKKWANLILTTQLWILIYNFFFVFTRKGFSFNSIDVLKELLFFMQVPMGHMWYMPMIIGIYLFLPIFSRALYKLDVSVLRFPLIVIGIYLTITPIFNILSGEKLYTRLDFGYSGGLYGFCILLGFLIRRGGINLNKISLCIGTILSFLVTVYLQFISYKNGVTYNVWYNCGSLLICSLGIFKLISYLDGAELYSSCFSSDIIKFFVEKISIVSFSIYFIHYPIMLMIGNTVRNLKIMLPIKVLILWSVTFILSIVVVQICYKSEFLRKRLLYIHS